MEICFNMGLDIFVSHIDLIEWLKDELEIQSPTGLDRIQMVIMGRMLPINSRGVHYE